MSTGPKRENFKTLITIESLHSGVCSVENKYSTNAGRTGRNWYLIWWEIFLDSPYLGVGEEPAFTQ